jgi:hypothetical protein
MSLVWNVFCWPGTCNEYIGLSTGQVDSALGEDFDFGH